MKRNRWEEMKAGEKERMRIRGTAIGKKAVRDFVRGLEIRSKSPYENREGMEPDNKIALASFFFFKWLITQTIR